MGAAQSTPGVVVQTALYAPAPFFIYPWKPLLNNMYGGDYEKSYKHFRMQHMDGTNLLLHCFCLVWQLSSNYALLGELDKACAPLAKALSLVDEGDGREGRIVTRITTALWCLHLSCTKSTPLSVKGASVASIYLAYKYLGDWFDRNWKDVVFVQGFFEAVAVQRLILNKPNSIGKASIVYSIVRTILWKYVNDRAGHLKDKSASFNASLALVATAVASSSQPLRTVAMGLFMWIIALLTGQKATYFWSAGMMATLAQGIAHAVAGELGTLQVLQEDRMDQTSYELSHVTFFPNLLFQACLAHVRALQR